MDIEIEVTNIECPHCGELHSVDSYVYEWDSIYSRDHIVCDCGAKFNVVVSCDVTTNPIYTPPPVIPIDEATGLPDVVAENQIKLF